MPLRKNNSLTKCNIGLESYNSCEKVVDKKSEIIRQYSNHTMKTSPPKSKISWNPMPQTYQTIHNAHNAH